MSNDFEPVPNYDSDTKNGMGRGGEGDVTRLLTLGDEEVKGML